MNDHPPAEHQADQTRDGRGRYTPTINGAELQAEAAQLHSEGWTYQRIADHQRCALSTAYGRVQDAIEAVIREPAEAAIDASLRGLAEERARLADRRASILVRRQRLEAMLDRADEDGEAKLKIEDRLRPVDDQLMRVDEQLRRNDESRRRLEGLDQPAKTNVVGNVTYEIVGMDQAPA